MGDSDLAEDGMAVASKIEDEGMADRTPSSVESTPEAEALAGASQEQPIQPVKRKGGRKPVGACLRDSEPPRLLIDVCRSTLRRKNASNATDKRKRLFVSGVRSISSNSRQPSSKTKTALLLCSRAIALRLMNASCFGTRTLCSSEYCSKRVGHLFNLRRSNDD